MLTKVTLKNIASYNDNGTEFSNLKKINFIYGNNGTGKSTFSRYFKNMDQVKYRDCSYEGNCTVKKLVYNKDFIDENFKSDNEIPGIFTLGKESVEQQKELDKLQANIEKDEEAKAKMQENLEKTNKEINAIEEEFKELIWRRKNEKIKENENLYKPVFAGLNNNKTRFLVEYLKLCVKSRAEVMNENELTQTADIVFSKRQKEILNVEMLNISDDINYKVFLSPIIGKEELDFASLIKKLNIHTWVHEGYKAIQNNNLAQCPLCRNELDDVMLGKLSEYFDDKFENDINELQIESEKYKQYAQGILNYLSDLKSLDNKYIPKHNIEHIYLKIQAKHEENLKYILEKERTPSNKIELNVFNDELVELQKVIEVINKDIENHNTTIKQIEQQRELLKVNVWTSFFYYTNEDLKTYNTKLTALKNKTKGIRESIISKEEYIRKANDRCQEIQNNMFGISSVVEAINRQLTLYGFKNFLLKATEEEGKYKIVREDGEDANQTLSEGEKTFITFLYYYHIVKNDRDKKILFIDDPISSLDSTVLYIVSSLIKDVIEKMDQYKIQQAFISTHNTYFFKEITYKVSNCSYYILRKDIESGSYVDMYEKNPITNAYESLWTELIVLKDSNSIIIQNIMRRILENYFKFLGGIELTDLINYFDEDEKIIVSSLIKWTHDGSHHIQEDLYVQQQSDMNEKYFDIFTKIFVKSNNEGHLEMMVNNCVTSEEENPFKLLQKESA